MFAGDFYLNEDFIVLKYNGTAGDISWLLGLCFPGDQAMFSGTASLRAPDGAQTELKNFP